MDNIHTRADNRLANQFDYNAKPLIDDIFEIKKSFDYQQEFIHNYDKKRCLSAAYGWGKSESLIKDTVYKPHTLFENWIEENVDKDVYKAYETYGAGPLLKEFNTEIGGHYYGAYCGVSFERHLQDVGLIRYAGYWPDDQTLTSKHAQELKMEGETLVKYQLYGIGKQGDINAFASEEFDFIYVDEWTLIPIENIRFLTTRLRRAGRPNMLTLAGIPPVMGSEHHQFLIDNKFTIFEGAANLNPSLDPAYYQNLLDTFPPGSLRNRYVYGLICSNDKSMFPYENLQYGNAPYFKKIIAFIDPAISENGDEFVIAVQGLSEGLVYNLDCFHSTGLHVNKQIDAVKMIQDKWSPNVFAMESNAYQMFGVQTLQKTVPNLIPIVSIKDKVTRALSYSGAWGNNKVFWAFKDEQCTQQHLSFPNGKHDDIVDAFVGCYNILNTGSGYKSTMNLGIPT